MSFDRRNNSIFGQWWWTVDRVTLFFILLLITFGAIMVTAASPSVAEKIGLESFYFVKRQAVFLSMSLAIMFLVSLLDPRSIRRFAALGFMFGIGLLVMVLLFGDAAKGAKRWIYIMGFSLQPSEFMKPFFIVCVAWLFSEAKIRKSNLGYKVAIFLYLLLVSLLILQPDFGMVVLTSIIFSGQLFLCGISIAWIAFFAVIAVVGALAAYTLLPHVAIRINSFLASSDGGASYQVKKSLEAFTNGGFFGKGPGEGTVKQYLPDSHTDFIFAVTGEELGAIACIILVILYLLIIFRSLKHVLAEKDLFIIYAVAGLIMQFGVQAMINMGVALNLLPTKGMTLPFISYGGSSMFGIAINIGMLLALTKKRYGVIERRIYGTV